MAGRFDFDSPGAAFVDTMAKVLAERKAEERQNMLDKLTQQAEERANRAETRAADQARLDEAYRTHQVKLQDEAATRETVRDTLPLLDPRIDPKKQLSPERFKLMKDAGWIMEDDTPVPGVSTSEEFSAPQGAEYQMEGKDPEPWLGGFDAPQGGPATPTPTPAAPAAAKDPRYRFIGDQAFRLEQRRKADAGRIIAGFMSSGDPAQVAKGQRIAEITALNNGIIPESLYDDIFPGSAPYYTVNPDTGTTTKRGDLPSNAKISVLPQDRAAGRDYVSTNRVDTNGHLIMMDSHGNTKTSPDVVGDTTQSPVGIPQNTIDALSDVQGILMENPDNPKAINQYIIAADLAIQSAKIGTKKVKQWASSYLLNPKRATEELIAGGFTEAEKDQADQLLGAIGARRFTSSLSRNVARPGETKQQAPERKPGERPTPVNAPGDWIWDNLKGALSSAWSREE